MTAICPLADALPLVPDSARLGIGGALLKRKPMRFLAALADAGVRRLQVFSFLASLDAEFLVARGCTSEVHSGYIGFEHLGFAPAVQAAIGDGSLIRHDYDELSFATGLRAAIAGLPFLPSRGGAGSAVVERLGLREVYCPYTGQRLLAVPALHLDVTVLHAEAADEDGNVLGPAAADFLFDMDANLARASSTVVVTVERIVSRAETRASNRRTLLFGFEVDAVVVVPGGARPTALPGGYPADLAAIAGYLQAASATPSRAAAELARLV